MEDEFFTNRITAAQNLDELTTVLQQLLSENLAVWEDGSLLNIKKLVERVESLRIEIYANEHPPPHFHVKAPGIDGTFDILTCELLRGTVPGRERRLIEWWHRHGRSLLIKACNQSRPTDCPVGPIDEEAA
jgi:Domain of unknown function (DUF4160)